MQASYALHIHSILNVWCCIVLLRLTFTLSAVCDKCCKIVITILNFIKSIHVLLYKSHIIPHITLTVCCFWINTVYSTTFSAVKNTRFIIKKSVTFPLCPDQRRCNKRNYYCFALNISFLIKKGRVLDMYV